MAQEALAELCRLWWDKEESAASQECKALPERSL